MNKTNNKLKYFYTINKICLIFCTLIFFQNIAFAYIDPGTGSMLLSVVLGVMTTLFFLVNSVLIKLKMLFFSKKDLAKNSIPFVIYSEGKQYFNVFKPILDEFEKREIPLVFYTSSKDDLFFDQDYKFVKGEYIGEGFKAYSKLAFLKADICVMTTPGLDVLQLRRSKFTKFYCHIFHAVASGVYYRLFSLDYYDAILCDGDFQQKFMRELEQKRNLKPKELITVGCTYLDVLSEKIKSLPPKEDKFTVLLAPSWGESGILRKYGSKLIDELAKQTDWNIVIRPHPQSNIVEKDTIDKLVERYKNNSNISWNYDIENLYILSQTDVMISDFSGVMYDYAILFNKPFIYVNKDVNKEIYDVKDIDSPILKDKATKIIGTELTEENFGNIVSIIKGLSNNEEILQAIEEIKNDAWQKQGESGKNIVDYLVKKQKELNEC